MKKMMSLALALILIVSLAACGGNPATTSAPPSQPSGSGGDSGTQSSGGVQLKVAVLVPDTINDGSWGTNGYEAAKAVAEAYGAEFSYVEIKSPSEVVDALTDYSERGFNLIFAHSYDYETGCKQVAPDYPNTYYVTSGGTTYMDNVTALDFKALEGSYLAGVMAASITKTGKVATLGPQELPTIMDTLNGFEAGVKATNPDVECVVTFTGSATDVGKARETVLALANNGVDVMDIHLNQACPGAYAAGTELQGKVKMIAGNGQVADEYPDLIVADTFTSYKEAFLTVAKDVSEGTFKTGEGGYSVGLAEKAIQFVPNSGMDIPQEALDACEKAYQDILDGTIVVERKSNNG